MGNLAAKLKDLFGGEKHIELCLVGLEDSGKTTILNILSSGYPSETMPTVGLNVKSVKKEGVRMKVWDLGGQEQFRGEWPKYTQGCDVVLFVVDASHVCVTLSHHMPHLHTHTHTHTHSTSVLSSHRRSSTRCCLIPISTNSPSLLC